MKPVYQTIFDDQQGNCMAACVASLLELPLDAVPNPHTTTWWDDWQAWLKERGLYLVEATGADWTPPGFAILVGTSPRGPWQHACVTYNGEIVHDPHPDGGGVETRTAYDLIVDYDPGASLLAAKLRSAQALVAELATQIASERAQALTQFDAQRVTLDDAYVRIGQLEYICATMRDAAAAYLDRMQAKPQNGDDLAAYAYLRAVLESKITAEVQSELLAARAVVEASRPLVAWYFDRDPDAEEVDADDLMEPLRACLKAFDSSPGSSQAARALQAAAEIDQLFGKDGTPSDDTAEPERAAVLALQRLADGTVCIHCGAAATEFRQVRRSYYAEPCGHRQGQGQAARFNAKIAAKRAREESRHDGSANP